MAVRNASSSEDEATAGASGSAGWVRVGPPPPPAEPSDTRAASSAAGKKARAGPKERRRKRAQAEAREQAATRGRPDPAIRAREAQASAAERREAEGDEEGYHSDKAVTESSGIALSVSSQYTVARMGRRMRRVRDLKERMGDVFTDESPLALATKEHLGALSQAKDMIPEVIDAVAAGAEQAEPMTKSQKVQRDLTTFIEEYAGNPLTRILESRDGEQFCILCNKRASEQHLQSAAHKHAAEVMAWGDFLAGGSEGMRNRRDGKLNHGMPGLPTLDALHRFWGASLPYFLTAGLIRLKTSPGIWVNVRTHSRRRFLAVQDMTADLGVICYKGQGKYQRTSDFWYYDELPTSQEVLDEYLRADPTGAGPTPASAGSSTGSAGSRTAPGPRRSGQRPWHSASAAPEGLGWWPVLALNFPPAQIEGMEPDAAPGTKVILLCCFYQVIAVEHDAWWAEVQTWD